MTKRLWMAGAALAACGLLWAALSTQAAPDKDKPTAADKDKPAATDKDKPATTTGDDDTPTDAKSSEQADAVADIVTAYKLADWGRRMEPQSPFALCTAAEVLNRTTLLPATEGKAKDRFTAPDSGVKQDANVLKADAEKLLDEAIKMAKTNKQDVATVQAMADAVRKGRGGLNGPLTYTMELRAGQTDTYNIKFERNQWVRIAVRNESSDSAIYLQVINDHGDKRADDQETNPSIAFIPHQHDGTDYQVKVTNKSKGKIVYQLFTN